jgi:hypothetical protein
MNRKDFFKRLGLGALAVAITPKIIEDIKKDINNHNDLTSLQGGKFKWEEYKYHKTNEEIVREWEETGSKLYLPYDRNETTCVNDIIFYGGIEWQVMYIDELNRFNCMPLNIKPFKI